jgi:hypothetical protein
VKDRKALSGPAVGGLPANAATLIAEVVPTHATDDLLHPVQVTPGHWIGRDDISAWHEAGHAVAYLHFRLRVALLTIEPPVEGGAGFCRGEQPRDQVFGRFVRDRQDNWWQGSVIHTAAIMAGPVAANAVRTGFGISSPLMVELLSPVDEEIIAREKAVTPGADDAFEQNCRTIASIIVLDHRDAFGALVQALVEHRTLEEGQVRDLWQQHSGDTTWWPTPAA